MTDLLRTPSEDEKKRATMRVAMMEKHWQDYGNNRDEWPWLARESYDRIDEMQRIYENRYA